MATYSIKRYDTSLNGPSADLAQTGGNGFLPFAMCVGPDDQPTIVYESSTSGYGEFLILNPNGDTGLLTSAATAGYTVVAVCGMHGGRVAVLLSHT